MRGAGRYGPVAGHPAGRAAPGHHHLSPAPGGPARRRCCPQPSRRCFGTRGARCGWGPTATGVFRWAGGRFTQELKTPAINGGAATADSSVWIATSIGLSHRQHGDWTRYNEEGVANHEIPDNIVEKLLPDNAGNLWVVMSDAICVFETSGRRAEAETELPTVKFLGRPGNELFGVASLPGTGRLFATTDGLLLLPAEASSFTSFAPATDQIVPKRLLRPLPAAGKPTLLQVDDQQRLWLVSEAGVTVLTTKELRRLVQAAGTGPAVAARR